jgi:hypothetical protein
MADFPISVYTPRETENLPGITYDASKKQNMFSEDFQNLGGEINAIETILGLSPQGSSASVGARISALDVILNKANLGSGYLMKWDGSKFVNSGVFQSINGNICLGTINGGYYPFRVDILGNTFIGSLNVENHINPAQLIFGNYQGNGSTFPNFIFNGPSQWIGLGQNSITGNSLRLAAVSGIGVAFSAMGTNLFNFIIDGNLGIATASPTAKADVNSDILRLRTAKTPASAGAAGNAGDICWDASYIYICISTNTWRRVAHATW